MKFASLAGRLQLLEGSSLVDVASESNGLFSPDPQRIYEQWDAIVEWSNSRLQRASSISYQPPLEGLTAIAPAPRQVFAIGLNYQMHVEESEFQRPESPTVFTKFPACITGPAGDIELSSEYVDWEVELVVVIGREARKVSHSHGWDYVAGLTAGQDISDREMQMRPPAQFSLGKSFPKFGPIGPLLVTPDEFPNPDDIRLSCQLNGQTVQDARTSELIFNIPDLIAELSAVTTLFPGDIIFTGTPAGVGLGMKPPVYLTPGDVVTTEIEGIGSMRHTFKSS